ncbi:MAG: hypothetical protein IPH33_10670 [Bacteroidetes bacterium]|nr:hypothetical protein [Bacteroidota bacterium]
MAARVSGTCIATDGGSSPLVSDVTLPSAGTYYIIIDSWAPPLRVVLPLMVQGCQRFTLQCDQPAVELSFLDNNCSGG